VTSFLFVCLRVCLQAYLRNYTPNRYQFMCMLPMVVTWSSSGGVAVRHVVPVLWMTSRLYIIARKGHAKKAYA